jgi:hypothetical protein
MMGVIALHIGYCNPAAIPDSRIDTLPHTAYEDWLEGLGDMYGSKLLDLFEWEQGPGNWLAMTQL